MKIRRKLPKPSPVRPPDYVIGYGGPPPSASELRIWFDLEYGGPLTWRDAEGHAVAAHTDWSAIVRLAVPEDESAQWRDRAGWDHSHAASVAGTSGARPSADLVLHAARLARGLTLLSQGTTYDVAAAQHLNPSDWTDRRLDRFDTADHVAIVDSEAPDRGQWFYTRGLRRFGLDEVEYFHPVGLTAAPIRALLLAVAAELIARRPPTNVGAAIVLPDSGMAVRIARHRTMPLPDGTLILREVQRDPS